MALRTNNDLKTLITQRVRALYRINPGALAAILDDIVDSYYNRNQNFSDIVFRATNVLIPINDYTSQLQGLSGSTLDKALERIDEFDFNSGGSGGLSLSQVDARILVWARANDTSLIPITKIPATIARSTDIIDYSDRLNQSQVEALFHAWALLSNADRLPADKLPTNLLTSTSDIDPSRVIFNATQKGMLGSSITTASFDIVSILADFITSFLARNNIITKSSSGTADITTIVETFALIGDTTQVPIDKIPNITDDKLSSNVVLTTAIADFLNQTDILALFSNWAQATNLDPIPIGKIPDIPTTKLPNIPDTLISSAIARVANYTETSGLEEFALKSSTEVLPLQKLPKSILGGTTASGIFVQSAGFTGNLRDKSGDDSAPINDVQKALNLIDSLPLEESSEGTELPATTPIGRIFFLTTQDVDNRPGLYYAITADNWVYLTTERWAHEGDTSKLPVSKIPTIPGTDVSIDASSFNNNLATTDTNVQLLAEKVDDLAGGGSTNAVDVTVDASAFDGNLKTTDTNVQLVANAVDDLSASSNEFSIGDTAPANPQLGWVWSDTSQLELKHYTYRSARDTSKDLTPTGLPNGDHRMVGLWSDGTTLWANNSTSIRAFTLPTGVRDRSKEFSSLPGNESAQGIWSNGTYMWVSGYTAANGNALLNAYRMPSNAINSSPGGTAFARETTQELTAALATAMHSTYPTGGIWSDGTTIWIPARQPSRLLAYTISTKARDSSKDFTTLAAAGNINPQGLWSDGIIMWVADTNNNVYAYRMPSNVINSSPGGTAFATIEGAKLFPLGRNSNNNQVTQPRGLCLVGNTMYLVNSRFLVAYDVGLDWSPLAEKTT